MTKKKWLTFAYHSRPIHKVTNLFKNINLPLAFRTNNTIHKYLCHQSSNSTIIVSRIYRLQCKTKKILCWSNWQVFNSATSRTHKIHKTNNPLSAYAMHILNNQYEYGNPEHTLRLLQPCQKGKTHEFLGIFIDRVTATTIFIDRRTENQRLKPPVLPG